MMYSSASTALVPITRFPVPSMPVAVRAVKIAFSSTMVSSTTAKSVIVSTFVAALSPVFEDELVGTAPSCQRVVGGVASERIAERIARAIERRSSGQSQVLDVGTQCGDRDVAANRVGAF